MVVEDNKIKRHELRVSFYTYFMTLHTDTNLFLDQNL